MTHLQGGAWCRHVAAHVDHLRTLVASGPLKRTARISGSPILSADSRAEVERLVVRDPFAIEKLTVSLGIFEWDPLFGATA